MDNITPGLIRELEENQIFCFGSNEHGKHGKGAAKQAMKWGAKYGVGEGLMGRTYGLPTKDSRMRTLPLRSIRKYIKTYLEFAESRKDLTFLTTPIGCGLAGYSAKDIAPLFFEFDIPDNVHLPEEFWELKNE